MITKWFFQEDFSKFPLLMLKAAVCSFAYPNIGCCNTNQILTFFYLTTDFYKNANWAAQVGPATSPHIYKPYQELPQRFCTWTKPWPSDKQAQTLDQSMPEWNSHGITIVQEPTNYQESVSWAKGYFQKALLSAVAISTVTNDNKTSWGQRTGLTPTNTVRYNPTEDTRKKQHNMDLKATLNNSVGTKPRDYPNYT